MGIIHNYSKKGGVKMVRLGKIGKGKTDQIFS